MDIQIQNKFYIQWNLMNILSSITRNQSQIITANSDDYGFDFDETELDNEMFTLASTGLSDRPLQQVEAGEFEARYHWFIS